MEKKILVVAEKPKTGKTTAIRSICEKMIAGGAELYFLSGVPRGQTKCTVSDLANPKKHEDIMACLIYRGVLIGIFSRGDDYYKIDIQVVIEIFIKIGCGLILCASHRAGSKTYRTIENTAQKFSMKKQIECFNKIKNNYIDTNALWQKIQTILQ